MILAIGNSGTYETDTFNSVLEELDKKGHKAVLFKQDKCLEGEYLVFEVAKNKVVYSVVIDGKNYNIDNFSAIWYMKPHLPFELIEFKPPQYRQFIHRQFRAMRTALWSIFREKKWIDNPWLVQIAEDKLYQLNLAAQIGFSIPDTLATSDPGRVKDFYKKYKGNIIVKILRPSPITNHVLAANRLTEKHLSKLDSLKMSPSIFQECISKKYELRITVVGSKIFTTKIYSQRDEATALDWRVKPTLNNFEVEMEATILPADIEQRIHMFMKKLGLRFGCIDMAVSKDGKYIFFEINPNGQWYFVQMRTKAKIAKAIANLLTHEELT